MTQRLSNKKVNTGILIALCSSLLFFSFLFSAPVVSAHHCGATSHNPTDNNIPCPPPQGDGAGYTYTYKTIIAIPGVTDQGVDKVTIASYLNVLYTLAVVGAALLAVVRIVIAGAKYMMHDLVSSKQDALNDIRGGLVGLFIILIAAVVLTTINPNLTNLQVISGMNVNNIGIWDQPTDVFGGDVPKTLTDALSTDEDGNERIPYVVGPGVIPEFEERCNNQQHRKVVLKSANNEFGNFNDLYFTCVSSLASDHTQMSTADNVTNCAGATSLSQCQIICNQKANDRGATEGKAVNKGVIDASGKIVVPNGNFTCILRDVRTEITPPVDSYVINDDLFVDPNKQYDLEEMNYIIYQTQEEGIFLSESTLSLGDDIAVARATCVDTHGAGTDAFIINRITAENHYVCVK